MHVAYENAHLFGVLASVSWCRASICEPAEPAKRMEQRKVIFLHPMLLTDSTSSQIVAPVPTELVQNPKQVNLLTG